MLTSLHLKNFVIVNEAELDLGPGMTAITGETGAGKSILVDALNLALGDRVSGDMIRHGQDKAEITALFDLADCSIALQWLREQELDEGDECIIRRVISRNSSSRGFINGRPVVMQQLKQIGDLLVDIHGQHEHQSLLRPADQREILDAVAGHDQELGVLAGLYDEIQQCRQQLDTLYAMSGSDDAQLDLLRYQVNELEQLELDVNEISSLEDEHRRLANSSDLINGANENLGRLSSDEPTDIEQQLGQSINHLQQMEKLDPSLGEVSKLLVNASIQVDEAIRQLRQYIEQMDTDPQRFAWVNERMGTIHDLARKHRVNTAELPTQLVHLKQQLMPNLQITSWTSLFSSLQKHKTIATTRKHPIVIA
jgi:DNA repair protein RecN (Recombination protein N)